jgi:hypothetical protein
MANTIKHKRGTTAPTAGQLVVGELAINTTTGEVYTKTDGGTVVALVNSNNPTFTGNVTAGTNLISANSSGDEGGEILLAKPQTNTTLSGTGVTIDVYQNKLRIFEQGGSARGAYIDLTAASNGVGTNLLSGGATSASWGSITGTLSSQTDLNTALGLKAPLASPTFTGVPSAPLATTGTDTTQLATTSFVQQELASGTAVAKKVVATVRNETGSTLYKGQVVYISGAGGNKALVSKAQADTEANSSGTYGLVQADIANNNNGTVVIAGIITGLDTDDYADGDKIYLSPTVAGGWTTTKPSAPDHMVFLGTITYAHANQGTIQLRIQNGFELEELHNVSIPSTPTDGDVLTYDSATGLWGAEAPSGGGGGLTITTLSNGQTSVIDSTVPTNGMALTFDSTAGLKWATVSGGGGLTDAPSDGSEYVRKDGAWAVATGGGGGGISDAPSDGKAYSRKDAGWVTNRINAWDNYVTYTVGDQVVFSNAIYEMTTAAGAAGYDPVSYPSYWTAISGPAGAAGTNGTNGTNGTMNPLDILTVTANSYGAYVSGSGWSVNYTFINSGSMGGSWMSNKYSTVYFNLYINGTYDSTISGSYTYYYASGSLTGYATTGDHIEVKISDGAGGEATINYADFYL